MAGKCMSLNYFSLKQQKIFVYEREGDEMWNEIRTWWRDYLEHVKSQPKDDNLQNQGQLLVYRKTKFLHCFPYWTTITFKQEMYMTMKIKNL